MMSANIFEVTVRLTSKDPIGAEADSSIANRYATKYGVIEERGVLMTERYESEVTFTLHVDPNLGLDAEFLSHQYWSNRKYLGCIEDYEIIDIDRTGPQYISREQLEYAVRESLIKQMYCNLHIETKDLDINDPEDFKFYLGKLEWVGKEAAVLKGLSITGLIEWLDRQYDVREQIIIFTDAARECGFDPYQLALNIRDQIVNLTQRIKHSQFEAIGKPGFVAGMATLCQNIFVQCWSKAGGPDIKFITDLMVQHAILGASRFDILVPAITNTLY